MRQRRQPEGLNLALLDIMSCGLGAVVLVFMLVKFNQDVSIPEDDLLRADLGRLEAAERELRRSLANAKSQSADTERDIESISTELAQLETAVSDNAKSNEAKRSELARLKGKIEKIEPAKKSDVIKKAGSGEENYLVGLKVEGSRIGILVDQSASMTDRRLIDIVRRKNSSEQDRKAGPKWQRTVRIVQWLLARLPARAEVAVVAFNGQARQLGGPNWTSSRDAEGLGKIIADLGKLAPLGPTNLQAGLDTINRMRPSDLYVLTDGLPTKGTSSFRSLNPFTNCNALWGGSSTISGECRLKLFTHTLTVAAPSSGVKVNGILLPIEGDPGAAHAFWTWTSSTGGLLVSPADGWP